jgi:uncharacterized YigZ family protein
VPQGAGPLLLSNALSPSARFPTGPSTLAEPAHAELLIKKSRFIACVQPVSGREQAVALVQALRALHPGAAHVCWALMAGGQSAAVDDGEPSGTAGRPMLDVLRHQQLEGVLATVVRYFGGVKLGAGGLVRAYTDAVATALLAAPKVALRRFAALGFEVPYELEGRMRRALQRPEVRQLAVSHGDVVRFACEVEAGALAALREALTAQTHAQLRWVDSEG